MLEMRMKGATFQEIADKCEISRQAVHERLKLYTKRLMGERGQGFDISTIIFEGIYQYFNENIEESLCSFAEKLYGYKCSRADVLKNCFQGKNKSKFSIPQIKRMCEICGKPFEEVFKERDAE